MGGVNVQMVARGVLAFELTGSVLAVSYVGAGFAPPILLFSLFGGAIADRVNRKQIIQYGQVGMALIAGGVAVSIITETVTIWHLIGASIMQGTLWAFLMPARQAIIPQIVGEKRMINAVALSSSGMALMTLAAPGIGGLAYFYFGPGTVYVVISLMAFASFLLTIRLPDVGKMPSKAGVAVLDDMKEGLRYVMQRRMVMLLLAMALSTAVLAMPFRSLLVVLVQDEFGRGADGFGFLLSAFGLGALVGSLGFAGMRATGPRGMALILTTTLSGIAILAAAVSPSYLLLMIIMVFVGLGDSGRRTLNSAVLMEQVDDEHRGRVMGLYMMNFGLMPLGIIPIAAIAEFAGIREALSVSAIILIAVGVSFFALSKRMREL
jgi:MFS family permease